MAELSRTFDVDLLTSNKKRVNDLSSALFCELKQQPVSPAFTTAWPLLLAAPEPASVQERGMLQCTSNHSLSIVKSHSGERNAWEQGTKAEGTKLRSVKDCRGAKALQY